MPSVSWSFYTKSTQKGNKKENLRPKKHMLRATNVHQQKLLYTYAVGDVGDVGNVGALNTRRCSGLDSWIVPRGALKTRRCSGLDS